MWTNLVPVLIYYGPAAVCLAQCTAPCTIARYRQRWREDKHIFHQQLLPAPLQSFPPVIPIFPPEANPAFHNSGANEAFLFRRFPSEGWRGPWSQRFGFQRSEAQEAKLGSILLHDEDRVEVLLCCRVSCCGGNTYIWSSWFIPEAQNRMNNSWGSRGQKMVEAIEAKERGHWGRWMTGREDRRGGTSYWCFVVWREPVLLIPIDQILLTSVLATIFPSSRDHK